MTQTLTPNTPFSSPVTLGWDIGGAHLKIAVLNETGHLIAVEQYPCALWRGLDQLTPLLTKILKTWSPIAQHAVTMSGEMVDLFTDRIAGVQALLQTFKSLVGETPVQVFCAQQGLIPLNETQGYETHIASANWLASATWAARYFHHGVLIDIGSTTTDILCFEKGQAAPMAMGDADRLISEELVYTGVTRTPLMALAQRITWQGASRGVMAELFATTADVYRVLNRLPQEADQHEAADGGLKTRVASMTRMARMIGLDGHEYDEAAWIELAGIWQSIQQAQIQAAFNRAVPRLLRPSAMRDLTASTERTPISVIVAGVGRFLVSGLDSASEEAKDFIPIEFASVGNLIHPDQQHPKLADYASRCAPAVAVAALLLNASS